MNTFSENVPSCVMSIDIDVEMKVMITGQPLASSLVTSGN